MGGGLCEIHRRLRRAADRSGQGIEGADQVDLSHQFERGPWHIPIGSFLGALHESDPAGLLDGGKALRPVLEQTGEDDPDRPRSRVQGQRVEKGVDVVASVKVVLEENGSQAGADQEVTAGLSDVADAVAELLLVMYDLDRQRRMAREDLP